MEIVVFYIPCPNKNIAIEISEALINQKLAACTNMIEGVSMFHWGDGMQRDTEVYLIAKTTLNHIASLELKVLQMHPYETPAVVHWIAQVNEAYGTWMLSQVN
ncbi:MAG: divalent-cation tolerance protein CutA [Saprospiraceae bacterium]